MSSLVRNITFDCHHAIELARFWSEVTGREVDSDSSDEEAFLPPANPDQAGLLFLRVPEGKVVKNRMHLDLQPDRPRDEEVDRLLALGASMVDDFRNDDGTGWALLADPEGNEFCVERSAAEREATG